ncbi:MAG: N-acetylneuraminate synthase family protein [Pyrinomonadaceae bacterium]|nr:N-acetylneuraminate synthase family protein [Sphingobacteriaceae bacterium]
MLHNSKPYLIGETAFHHEGDTDFLRELINVGIDVGVDALKFHLLFDVFDYMVEEHSAIDVIKKITIPQDKWQSILSLVSSKGIDIILLCNDLSSLQWVNKNQSEFNLVAIEIHATGLNDLFLLREAANFHKTVILGVGGSTFDEIKYAVDFLIENDKKDIFLMHGFQNYPTMYEDINLKRMSFLKDAFGLPIGYADHTDPEDEHVNVISVLPQVSGFNVLEKHFTHKYGEKRIDAQAAVSLENLKKTKQLMNIVASTLGKDNFSFSAAEKKYGDTGPMKKAIVARKPIKKGSVLDMDNLAFKRTNHSSKIQQSDLEKVLGAKTSKDLAKDELIDYSSIEYNYKTLDFKQFFVNDNK